MKELMKRYRFFIVTIIIMSVLTLINNSVGIKAIGIIGFSFKEMLLVIPPIFIL